MLDISTFTRHPITRHILPYHSPIDTHPIFIPILPIIIAHLSSHYSDHHSPATSMLIFTYDNQLHVYSIPILHILYLHQHKMSMIHLPPRHFHPDTSQSCSSLILTTHIFKLLKRLCFDHIYNIYSKPVKFVVNFTYII